MTHTKSNIPICEEQQIIQQKIKILSNFIELKTKGKNYMCSTQGWKEPVCERYGFSANGKWVQLDISHKLMAKLELELREEIIHPIYISPAVLEQKPDEVGGITVDNEKDIICQKEGIILVQEKEVQVDFTTGEITDLKQKLKNSEELTTEKNNIQNELNNLENKLKRVQGRFLGSLFWSGKKSKEIKDLKIQRVRLRTELIDKNQQITTLTTQRNNLQTQANNLNGTLRNRDQTITDLNGEKNRLNGEINNLKNQLQSSQNERNNYYNQVQDLNREVNSLRNDYYSRNQEVSNLNSQLSNERSTNSSLRNRIDSLQSEISSLHSYRTPTPPRHYSPPRRQPSPPRNDDNDDDKNACAWCQRCEKLVVPSKHGIICPSPILL